ncbi:DUF262 domain-containing protein [Cupriavidus sp. 2TAF22]|uniref:DUF262 domain-containing protein n=1 Tax=unclassified Cupriavidus TaxID=2640874 RepID=UPI003F8FCFCE
MGTMLLHRNAGENKRYIIDGQQRFTALCTLYFSLHGELPPNTDLNYRSVDSATHIRQALASFREASDLPKALFDHLCFTVIEVPAQDLAFAFFDTQNNRGVPLGATDLLKAFHLRAIRADGPQASDDKRQALEHACAKRWETMQVAAPVPHLPGKLTPALFNLVLWRARRWRGRHIGVESHDALLREFQQRAQPAGADPARVPLYPGRHNRRAAALLTYPSHSCQPDHLPDAPASRPADLPFSMRQPIHAGTGFFLYADKYAALVGELMLDKHADAEVRGFRALYDTVVSTLSVYLREVFLLGTVMYVDRFGFEKLVAFATYFEHLLGGIRLGQKSVVRETARNIFRDGHLNLLDVIAGAFEPEEVIAYLRADPHIDEAYRKYEKEPAERNTVRGRYKAAVLKHYTGGQQCAADLTEKRTWMHAHIGWDDRAGAWAGTWTETGTKAQAR